MNTYHFIPANKLEYLKKIKDHLTNPNLTIILDLEDALYIPNDTNTTDNLKFQGRAKLKHFFTTLTPHAQYIIRINNPTTDYFQKDIELVKNLLTSNKIKGIVVPKADISSLSEVNEQLQNITCFAVYPLIETKKGAEELLDTCKNFNNIAGVIFGHHDYFLDINVFPIPESALTSKNYRIVMSSIYNHLKPFDIEYIDGIYPYLADEEGLIQNLSYLKTLGKLKTGKLSVHKNQIAPILNFQKTANCELTDDATLTQTEKIQEAEQIVISYSNRTSELGVTQNNLKYISPQMYQAALHFLNTIQK